MAVQDGGGEDPGEAIKARYLAKCVQRSSVVLHAVYGHIRCPSTFDVVLGKETSLELVVVTEDGIVQSVCEQPVFGTVKDLRVLPWNESRRSPSPQTYEKDLLVLLSDSGKLSFLTFNIELHRFLAVAHVHIADYGNLRRELGRLLAVEPRGCAVAVAAFEDRIAIFPTSIAAGNNVVDKRMIHPKELLSSTGLTEASGVEEKFTGWGTIWSMTFVGMPDDHSTSTAKSESLLLLAALVHRKGAASNEIFILMCDTKERIIQVKARYDPSTIRPSLSPLGISILDVPAAPGFLLLSRSGELLLLDLRRPSSPSLADICSFQKSLDEEEGSLNTVAASALLQLTRGQDGTCKKGLALNSTGELTEAMDLNFDSLSLPTITAWSWEPYAEGQSRLALAMDTGEILLARLSFKNSDGVPQIEIQHRQYKCSPCNLVLWTKGDLLAVFVEMGDGQVLQCSESGKVTCKSVIQNLAPILDFALADYHNEKQDQMFACSGAGSEGSLRVIRNGISVEKLHTTSPMYQGVTGTYTMRMCRRDPYHAFFVMSFVQETRVLSVGLNFVDITEAVGFQSCASTLACGTIEDYHVVQVCSKRVTVCVPTKAAHPAGIDSVLPLCSSWKPPQGLVVSLGAVASKTIILALSKPGLIVMLGSQQGANGALELCILQQCELKAELSCISIPDEEDWTSSPLPPSIVGLVEGTPKSRNPSGIEVGKICVVGTHEPSVEVLSIVPGERLAPLAVGHISLVSCVGTTLSGCVPESVRLAQFDGLYILAGLRNGMLLRYEWPASPSAMAPGSKRLVPTLGSESVGITQPGLIGDKLMGEGSRPVSLHLVAVRRIGVSPVSLVSLQASLSANIVALSDRPWLLQTARHSQRIAYTSISFPPSTHATPVNSIDCPNGILFVADCSLHLVEMEHLKRLNVQKLPLGRTPRRILYHSESKTLVVMRTDPGPDGNLVSDLCCVDPLSGASHSCYTLEAGEVARSIHIWKYRQEQLLLVGTSLSSGGLIMSSGEAESSKGRLLVFQLEPKFARTHSQAIMSSTNTPTSSNHLIGSSSADPMVLSDSSISTDESDLADGEVWELRLKTHVVLPGAVLSVSSYLGQYVLASAGNCLFCLGFSSDSPQRLRRFAMVKTRFMITSLTVHLSRIAVSDCRDGVLFYSYQEATQQLEQLYCDPIQQPVADCALMDMDTAVVTDRRGNFCTLSSASTPEESVSPERNLSLSCWYHVGETLMRIHKASFAYESPTEESLKNCGSNDAVTHSTHSSVVASSLLGSVFIFIKVTREEYDLLKAVQSRLAFYPLTSPLLGNNHDDYRSQGCPAGVCKVLDGDMLCQFLELTSTQQENVLTEPQGVVSLSVPNQGSSFLERSLPVDRVLRLLERVHNSLA
ncbi:hypothetical protein M758_3G031700 [Ceratodon purpureus]|nr:hypothetical protein M758_3G031700 [Ceratodon purpureus]